jgi:hypothetical protein
MTKNHYCLTETIYENGYQVRRLEPVAHEFEDYRTGLFSNDDLAVQYGTYCRDIEAVKELLLHEFLSQQFEPWDLSLRRFEDKDGHAYFYIDDMITGDQLYETRSWDGVMDAFTKYVEEDRFRVVRDSGNER